MSSRCFLPAEKNSSPGDPLLFQTAKSRNMDKQTTTKVEEPKISKQQSERDSFSAGKKKLTLTSVYLPSAGKRNLLR